ncbi:MAG TPA: DUF6268 family outer membrane beta-barrel protein [Pricia sp.]|nr:DUF6268 family outer membrane beta-barrel protein [Pricia sp.]
MKYLSFGISFLWVICCGAQTPDIFRAEYMMMPRNDQDAKLSRIKLVANLPITLKDSSNIIIGGEYNRLSYGLKRDGIPEEVEGLKHLHVADFNLAYVYRYNEFWRIIGVVTPRLSSTLGQPIEKGDISFNVTGGVLREKKHVDKPSILVLGIAYNSTVALRVPLPIIYYERRFHEHWTYVIGAPKTAIKYHFNEKHQLQSEFILDGYYVNLQNSILLPGGGAATSISSSAALGTFGYQYAIKKSAFLYIYGGHTLFQKSVLRNSDRDDIFTLNDGPSFYMRAGFRIGL